MLPLIQLLVVGFIVLTVIYVVLSLWSRSVRKRKLLDEWEEAGRPGDRDDWLRLGLDEYNRSLRRKLLLGVYIVPVVIVAAIIYLTNFN